MTVLIASLIADHDAAVSIGRDITRAKEGIIESLWASRSAIPGVSADVVEEITDYRFEVEHASLEARAALARPEFAAFVAICAREAASARAENAAWRAMTSAEEAVVTPADMARLREELGVFGQFV